MGKIPLINPPRLLLISSLTVFLFFSWLLVWVSVEQREVDSRGAYFPLVWVSALIAHLLLCAILLKEEPGLVRRCLVIMGTAFLLIFFLIMRYPAVST